METPAHSHGPLRLLPWSGPDGQPCYLAADPNGTGHVSRLADEMETAQLAMGSQLLGYARGMLGDRSAGPYEIRFLCARLCEALGDALRVAESRGGRLTGSRAPLQEEPGAGSRNSRRLPTGSAE
ncbi:hypothetical protein [Streptomyces daliensis]